MAVTVNDVKLALRIGHSQLDTQLTNDIADAKAYLVNQGVLEAKVVSTGSDPMVDHCILAYCKWQECAIPSDREGYEMEFRQWLDELRKTPAYYKETKDV